ncbi:MAG: class I tRNA ligase family protein [Patescibacteria group bacterium]
MKKEEIQKSILVREVGKTARIEEDILEFWKKNKIFEISLKKKSLKGDYVFYDGPPFATGLPHYGHVLASVIKDVIPRYKTMQGYNVPRRWGWDCHGLPIENLIEKELNLKTKKDIEDIGIEKFNTAAKNSVLAYADEWKKFIPRIGRWVNMESDYKTMDVEYMESVWWVFKELYEKGFIYDGYKSMHICPRCETTLANFEVNLGYKNITDISTTVKFELEDEPNTFILAWTTTPWTLPGNVALAVGENIEYVKAIILPEADFANKEGFPVDVDKKEYIIFAKKFLSGQTSNGEYVFNGKAIKIEKEFNGKDLIGRKYKPVFDYYYNDKKLENRENGWKIYGADFVTTEEGTGVVHIAPAFGEDDMNLGKKENLPFIQHVGMDGRFKLEVGDFPKMSVKPKENSQLTDIEIIKWLAHNGKLFSKEKILHSYSHCWRCDTPLLNYAASSWFVEIEKIKERLVKNNQSVNWVPEHIKEGRFGKWLLGARDWAISRSRFWGTPLPVWKCENCKEVDILGSISDIAKRSHFNNKYIIMRHGEAEFNRKNIVASSNKHKNNLTKKGISDVKKTAKSLKGIDFIITSPFRRTLETAELVAKELGIKKNNVIKEPLLAEINTGIFDGHPSDDYHSYFNGGKVPTTTKEYFSSILMKFDKKPPKGESLKDLKKRMHSVIVRLEKKYKGKNILIVSHEYSLWMLETALFGWNNKKSADKKAKMRDPDYIKTAEARKINTGKLPLNKNGDLDLHRPYIDDIKIDCKKCDKKMNRIEEVFDCWFESGSMPYGQAHYPFENKKKFDENFPAEFIAEGIDQTRGWFYTLLALSTALFGKTAYKNVIVNGVILAEDGQKISKKLKNYPDPMDLINKYGADAMRYYLLSSPVVSGESFNFSEKGVDEVHKKIIIRLLNVFNFFEIYADDIKQSSKKISDNVLDEWIVIEFENMKDQIINSMELYELNKAVRPLDKFIEDFSTWYLRRSRDRFKKDGKEKENAIITMRYILLELSKVMAPFTPFISEYIYQKLSGGEKSVHLESYPKIAKIRNQDLSREMSEVRKIVSEALEQRAKLGIKVRQPLKELRIKNDELRIKSGLLELIKDEINVKKVTFNKGILENVELDTDITQELKLEGMLRDLIRNIQEERKNKGLTKSDFIKIIFKETSFISELVKKYSQEIKIETITKEIELVSDIESAKEMKVAEEIVIFVIATS